MTPKLDSIDHVHINVANWGDVEKWYQENLGFRRVESLMSWVIEYGPLTIENPESYVHLALFESNNPETTGIVAIGTGGTEFLAWKEKLEELGLNLRLTDQRRTS